MTRLTRRTFSDRFSSSSWKGGVTAALRISSLVAEHLDLARGHVGVLGAGGTAAHLAGDLQHEFVAHGLGELEHLGPVGIADDLGDAFAVAQVDEDHAAMVAAAMVPAAEGDDLVDMAGIELAAVMGTHGGSVDESRRRRDGDGGRDYSFCALPDRGWDWPAAVAGRRHPSRRCISGRRRRSCRVRWSRSSSRRRKSR